MKTIFFYLDDFLVERLKAEERENEKRSNDEMVK